MLDTMPRQAKPAEQQAHPATVRIPPDLWTYIEQRAEQEDRSVNYIAVRLMRLGQEQEQRGKKVP